MRVRPTDESVGFLPEEACYGWWAHRVERVVAPVWEHVLRGDSRGWSARHHREHCEGDYKRPPPRGIYRPIEAHSEKVMRRKRVELTKEQRMLVCERLVESILKDGAELLALCVNKRHWHALLRCKREGNHYEWNARHLIGRAKGRCSTALGKLGLAPKGGLFAKRCKVKAIRDRTHQVNVFRYIPAHRKKGAVAWASIEQRCW
jgi:hypothetical protein